MPTDTALTATCYKTKIPEQSSLPRDLLIIVQMALVKAPVLNLAQLIFA